MTSPCVSVVLCVYNQAAYVAEAIESILRQTLTDLELIVVDDASTDATPSVIQGFADARLRYVRNATNLGHAGSLNRGFALARGAYLAIMDSDDISLPERLERQVTFLERHPEVALCGAWVETFGARQERRCFPTEPAALAVRLLMACPFSTPTVVMRRDAWLPGGFDFDAFGLAFDYAYWVAVANRAAVANVPAVLLKYRLHAGQTTTTRRAAQLAGTRLVLRQQLAALLGELQETDVETLTYVFVNEATGNPPTALIGDLFERIRRANQRVHRYDPVELDRLLVETWAHIVADHEPDHGRRWREMLRRPALWSWPLGAACLRRTLRPLKTRLWKRRPA
ncbi:MAG: glycosyltransferase family 2 protein [Chloracidobacterium sp.]